MSARASKSKKFDVVVIGAGPLGWCVAQLLGQAEIKTLLIEPKAPSAQPAWLEEGLGVFWPSLNDPPTRALVAHGAHTAEWLQRFCAAGVSSAGLRLGQTNVQPIVAYRVGIAEHEIRELAIAEKELLGLVAEPSRGAGIFRELGAAGLVTFGSKCNGRPLAAAVDFRQNRVAGLNETKDGCFVSLDNGERVTGEMVVVATGHNLAQLVPWLGNMLVPMTDVLSEWSTGLPAEQGATPFALRTASGHVAALFQPKRTKAGILSWQISMTGPRFLLPRAGAGLGPADTISTEALCRSIGMWLETKLLPALAPSLLDGTDLISLGKGLALECNQLTTGIDCLPCDELPILGELGTQGRVLGATGWLGCGWSAGFRAAEVLVEIIKSGRSDGLLPILKPQRWRSGLGDGVTGMT